MLDRKAAARIAQRFSGIPGFPQTAAGLDEMVAMIADRVVDDEHAAAFADDVLENLDYAPTPKQVAEIARRTLPSGTTKSFGCRRCDFTGFIPTTITAPDGRTLSASAPCPCRPPIAPDPDEWRPLDADHPKRRLDQARILANGNWAEDEARKLRIPAN